MTERPHVVVVGAGVSGLAAAHAIRQSAGESVRVTVLEQTDRLGGALRTGEVGGLTVDLGAESVLARRPEAVRLAEQVGLGPALVHPAVAGALLWTRGRLRRLPSAQLMGIPTDLRELAAADVLSLCGLARIPLDSLLPGEVAEGDRSVGRYVAARLGREVVDRLVEPLLGGVYAGHADELSLDAVLPQLAGAVRVERSLVRAAQRVAAAAPSSTPVFAGLRGGVGRLPSAVASASGADVRLRAPVRDLARTVDGWRVTVGSARAPEQVTADAVVLAVPAAPTARLLVSEVPAAAELLNEIPYASVAIVTLVVDGDLRLPSGTGFLVPPVDGRVVKAATFSSQKWAWVGESAGGRHVLRASVGRHGSVEDLQRDDGDLVAAVVADLGDALGAPLLVEDSLVTRWGGALPQYLVGHPDRVLRIRDALRQAPGLAACGAAYDGVGIAACVASGTAAATAVLRHLGQRRQWGHERGDAGRTGAGEGA